MNVLRLLLKIWICLPISVHARLHQDDGRILEPRRSPGTSTENYGSYGGSSASSSSSIYGSASYNQNPSSYSSYDSQPSTSQYSNYGKSSHYGNSGGNGYHYGDALHVPITWVILLNLSTFLITALITAYQFEHRPEGNFANFCRLCINTLECACKVIYNLYHCRLSEIPTVVSAEDDDDEYTEQELQSMKLRPGIAKALDVEHHKSMRRTAQQIKTLKAAKAKQSAKVKGSSIKTPGRR